MSERAVSLQPKTWNEIEDDFLRAMERFDSWFGGDTEPAQHLLLIVAPGARYDSDAGRWLSRGLRPRSL